MLLSRDSGETLPARNEASPPPSPALWSRFYKLLGGARWRMGQSCIAEVVLSGCSLSSLAWGGGLSDLHFCEFILQMPKTLLSGELGMGQGARFQVWQRPG